MKRDDTTGRHIVRLVIVAIIVAAIVLTLVIFLVKPNSSAQIRSFDECVAAGYPVQLSYPGVCTVPGGKSFTDN